MNLEKGNLLNTVEENKKKDDWFENLLNDLDKEFYELEEKDIIAIITAIHNIDQHLDM